MQIDSLENIETFEDIYNNILKNRRERVFFEVYDKELIETYNYGDFFLQLIILLII